MLPLYEMNERSRTKLTTSGIFVRLESAGEHMMRGVKFFSTKPDSFLYQIAACFTVSYHVGIPELTNCNYENDIS